MALKYKDSKYLDYSGALQVTSSIPLDIRSVVANVSDLTTPSTWYKNGTVSTVNIAYKGMIVSVEEDQILYMCVDPANISSMAGWQKVGGSTSKIEVVTIKQYEASYNVPLTDPLNPGKTVALYGRHEIPFESEENDTAFVWYRADDPGNDNNTVPDESAIQGTVLADGAGVVIVNESVLSEGVYIKVTDVDTGSVTYAKINFDDLYDKISEVNTRIDDISTYIEDVSVSVSKIGKAFIFRGGALYNSDTTVTPDASNYLVKDEYDTPLDNLHGGDVYQTTETDGDKEWVYVEDSSVDGHWIELGLALGGFVSSINVSTDNFVNASVNARDANGLVNIDISINVGTIDAATENSSMLVTAYDVSSHLKTIEDKFANVVSNVSVNNDISTFVSAEPSTGSVVLNASIATSTSTAFTNSNLVTDGWVNEKFAWVCID